IAIDDRTGLLSLYGTGKAKVTAVSSDGAYKDSIIINVTSSKVIAVKEVLLTNKNGTPVQLTKVGDYEYTATLTPGNYQFGKVLYPESQKNSSVTWTSSNENVLKINQVTGSAVARLSGEVELTLDCANSIEGVFNPIKITVTVPYVGGESGLTIEGLSANELLFNSGIEELSFLIEFETPRFGLGESFFLTVEGDVYCLADGEPVYEPLDNAGRHYRVTLKLAPGYPEKVTLTFAIGANEHKSTVELTFRDFSFNVYTSSHLTNDDTIYQKNGDKIEYVAEGNPNDDDVIYEWYCSDDTLQIIEKANGKYAEITASESGEYDLTVSAYKKVVSEGSIQKGAFIADVVKTISVIRGISSIEFVDNAKNYGIEDMLTIGDTTIESGGLKPNYRHELKLKVVYDDGETVSYSDDLKISSDNTSAVEPYTYLKALQLTVKGDGVVKMTASWKNGVFFDQNVSASIIFRAVKDSVVIGAVRDGNQPTARQNYEALRDATNIGKKIVLMQDVMLGWQGMTQAELQSESKEMYTDYDWTFYKLLGDGTRPKVRYLIEFKDDVYGNGFTINAENFTTACDSTGQPLLFKGPLDFIAVGSYGAVKAQDNICFLVREKGILINNVNLMGCSNDKLKPDDDGSGDGNDNGAIDINKLNYVGTVLEISGNTTLINSRVSHGRTAVRIFGGETTNGDPIVENYSDVNVAEERLVVKIESCVIRQAREFLIKIGSNRAVRVDNFYNDDIAGADGVIPKLPTNASGAPYQLFGASNQNDPYFYDNYVITDVTLKNSVLTDSGLFAIAMDTHFNGYLLAESMFAMDMASNAFPSVLRMEGDVKIYNWKKLEDVDSSTLIETSEENSRFNLNLAEMVRKVAALKTTVKDELGQDVEVPKFPGMTTINADDGKEYAHAGIVFYGGGENYSYLDMSKSSLVAQLSNYKMNLSVLGDDEEGMDLKILQLAAGDKDFSFYMYNASSAFNLEKQQSELSSGTAYELPVARVEDDA
ncbi:MAG: hypothetical protein J6V83_05960, partial [Clostridia bacterium]|nr:hypothetical protein [Clostridia bacterium]